MSRLERLRTTIDGILATRPEVDWRTGHVHLYGVSATCTMLAVKRGLDVDLCAAAGMLHDIATYESGDSKDHAARGAVRAAVILREVRGYTEEETASICEAISTHSQKGQVHGPMAELLKDADLLQHFLYNPRVDLDEVKTRRVSATLAELGIRMSTGRS